DARRRRAETGELDPPAARSTFAPRVLSRLAVLSLSAPSPPSQLALLAAGGSPGHPRFARAPARRATRGARAALAVRSRSPRIERNAGFTRDRSRPRVLVCDSGAAC